MSARGLTALREAPSWRPSRSPALHTCSLPRANLQSSGATSCRSRTLSRRCRTRRAAAVQAPGQAARRAPRRQAAGTTVPRATARSRKRHKAQLRGVHAIDRVALCAQSCCVVPAFWHCYYSFLLTADFGTCTAPMPRVAVVSNALFA